MWFRTYTTFAMSVLAVLGSHAALEEHWGRFAGLVFLTWYVVQIYKIVKESQDA